MTATDALAEPVAPVPAPEPPSDDLTPAQWLRANLFSGPVNTVVTIVAGLLTLWVVYRLAWWAFITSDWEIIRANLRLFMVGRFPTDELWRPWVSGYVLAAALGIATGVVAAGVRAPFGTNAEAPAGAPLGGTAGAIGGVAPEAARAPGTGVTDAEATVDDEGDGGLWGLARRLWPLALAGILVLSLTRTILPTLLTILLVGMFVGGRVAGARLPAPVRRFTWLIVVAGLVASLVVVTGFGGIGWEDWGGLHLNVAASVAGIALAFPLGLVLALGRRSSLPGIRVLSVGYIELFRAVPLVALLFVSRYMVGFLFPTQVEPPSYLVRAVIVITLFEAAYIAEIVRGGLQSVPRGQVEAAQAIGLSPPRVLRLVVLPQALRAVIPAMVGQFISLFKDTSLLSIVSFFEMLAVAEVATEQDAFRGQGGQVVTLTFVGLLFWAGCSTMARESRRLERRLGVGER